VPVVTIPEIALVSIAVIVLLIFVSGGFSEQ
jgi:hypothetical protein